MHVEPAAVTSALSQNREKIILNESLETLYNLEAGRKRRG